MSTSRLNLLVCNVSELSQNNGVSTEQDLPAHHPQFLKQHPPTFCLFKKQFVPLVRFNRTVAKQFLLEQPEDGCVCRSWWGRAFSWIALVTEQRDRQREEYDLRLCDVPLGQNLQWSRQGQPDVRSQPQPPCTTTHCGQNMDKGWQFGFFSTLEGHCTRSCLEQCFPYSRNHS